MGTARIGKGMENQWRKLAGSLGCLHGCFPWQPQYLELAPFCEQYFGLNCLGPAEHLNLYFIARFMRLEDIGKVIQVSDVFPIEFDEYIPRLKTSLSRGSSIAHIGETDAVRRLIEIGDATEIWAISATATGAPGGSLRLRHALEPGAFRVVSQTSRDLSDVAQELGRIGHVDFVPGVAGLVIIAVQAAEEEQHRNLLDGERHVIAAAVTGGFR